MATQEKTSNSEVVTVNIQPFLLPGSILLSAIILTAGFIIGMNNLGGRLAGTSATGTTGTTVPPTAGDNVPTTPTTATISIDDDPIKGDKNSAKVAIVEFSDYECPFCQRHFQQTYSQIVKDYIDTGKVIYVFRDYPLSFHEPAASREAMGVNCVKDLAGDTKYFELHDWIYNTTPSNGTGIDQAKISEKVGQMGINRTQFDNCVKDEKFKDEIQKDLADGSAAGITGTPGFVVGVLGSDGMVTGELISGAMPYDTFKTAIENQLNK